MKTYIFKHSLLGVIVGLSILGCTEGDKFDYNKNVAFIWNVSAPLEMRVMRVMKRSSCTREEVLARISKQISDNERNEKSNDIIYNDGIQPVIPQLRTLLAKYEK